MGIYEITTEGGTYQIETEDATSSPRAPRTYDEAEAGNWLNILNALTLGFGDEIVGGGNALIDSLMGNDSIGNAYDSRLKQARELRTGFREENPGLSLAQDIGGGAMLPAGKLVSGAKGFVPKVGAAAIEGAGFGGAYGFGESEGGFQNRSYKGIESAKTGALLSGALSTPFAAVESFSPFLNKAGQAMKRKSLGATQADYTRTADQIGAISESGEIGTKTKKALDYILKDPVVKNTTDPVELLTVTREKQRDLAGRIRKTIDQYDEAVNANIEPNYSRASTYIEKSVPADKVDLYRSRLAKFKEAVAEEGKGRLGYLQDQKIALGKLWDPNDTTQNGFVRELYGDLQNTIEKHVPDVKKMNDDLSNWLISEKVFGRQVAKTEAQSLPETMRGLMRTSGGFGVPFLAGMYSGNPLLGLLGGAAGAYATSPGGQRNLGQGLQALSRAKVPESLAPLAAALVGAGGSDSILNQLGANQLLGSSDQYVATRDQGQGQTGQNYSPQGQISTLLERSLLEQGGRGVQGSSADTFKQELEKRLGSPNDYRPESPPTQGEFSDMYNPVKYKGKEVPFDNLVNAVVQVESAGKANAEGPKTKYGTAKGAMQILDSTGEWIMKQMGRDPKDWDPYNESLNREAGTWYLNYLIEKFNDPRLALIGYNWGPGNLDRLIKRVGTKDFDKLYTHLPKETRQYIPKIEKNLAIEV